MEEHICLKQVQSSIIELTQLSIKDSLATNKTRSLAESKMAVLADLIQAAQQGSPEQAKIIERRRLMECDLRIEVHEANIKITEYERQIELLQEQKADLAREIDAMELLPSP